jgi:hypothetical protein
MRPHQWTPDFKGRPVSDATWDRLRKATVVANVTGATPGLSEEPEQTDAEHQQQVEGEGEEMEETVPPLYKTRSALEEDRELRVTIQWDTSSLTLSERVHLEVELYKGLPPISMAEYPV